jgi:cellulose synthase/poly-beta-1,6-N-acetylglucosamine synthase-like glycosyltransferase
MMGEVELKRGKLTTQKSLRKTLLTPLVCSVLASFGIFGGISSLFVGIVFVVINSVVVGDSIFDRIGTLLLIFAIPMILIGSIFLDEIEGKK